MKLRLDLSHAKEATNSIITFYSSLKKLFENNKGLKKSIKVFFEDPENVELLNKNDFDKLARKWKDGSIFRRRKAPYYIVDFFLNILVLCGIDVVLDSSTIDDVSYLPHGYWVEVK